MWDAAQQWLAEHEAVLWALGALSLLTLAGSALLLPVLVARMPADYFLESEPPAGSWRRRHPLLRVAIHGAKNALGAVLALAGLALIPLPGQGVLTLLLGLALLDFPGKRRIELRLVRLPRVLRTLNWIRGRAGHPPLRLPSRDPAPDG